MISKKSLETTICTLAKLSQMTMGQTDTTARFTEFVKTKEDVQHVFSFLYPESAVLHTCETCEHGKRLHLSKRNVSERWRCFAAIGFDTPATRDPSGWYGFEPNYTKINDCDCWK